LKELGDGFGGDGFGVVSVGQDTAFGAAPAEAVDALGSKEQSLIEQELPVVLF